MMRIFITGGTGFFGKAILRYLVSHHASLENIVDSVTVLSRNPENFLKNYPEFRTHSWLTFCQGDICSPESLPRHRKFTHFIHAATDSTYGPQLSSSVILDQIVRGTQNILDLAVHHQAKRVLLTSSGGVYGPQPSNLKAIPESWNGIPDPINPRNSYSIGKRFSEHLCAVAFAEHQLDFVIARCFAFVGQDLPLNVHFAIGNFIQDALQSKDIVIKGDGTPIRTYLDQRDLAEWLFRMLLEAPPQSVYNVGSDEEISILDLAHLVQTIICPQKKVLVMAEKNASNFRNRYVPDINKIRNELNLKPNFSVRESIASVMDVYTK